jgi:hypothetical protein
MGILSIAILRAKIQNRIIRPAIISVVVIVRFELVLNKIN